MRKNCNVCGRPLQGRSDRRVAVRRQERGMIVQSVEPIVQDVCPHCQVEKETNEELVLRGYAGL